MEYCPGKTSCDHDWKLLRTVVVRANTYHFYECAACTLPVMRVSRGAYNPKQTREVMRTLAETTR